MRWSSVTTVYGLDVPIGKCLAATVAHLLAQDACAIHELEEAVYSQPQFSPLGSTVQVQSVVGVDGIPVSSHQHVPTWVGIPL